VEIAQGLLDRRSVNAAPTLVESEVLRQRIDAITLLEVARQWTWQNPRPAFLTDARRAVAVEEPEGETVALSAPSVAEVMADVLPTQVRPFAFRAFPDLMPERPAVPYPDLRTLPLNRGHNYYRSHYLRMPRVWVGGDQARVHLYSTCRCINPDTPMVCWETCLTCLKQWVEMLFTEEHAPFFVTGLYRTMHGEKMHLFKRLPCTNGANRNTAGERIMTEFTACHYCTDIFRINLNLHFGVIDASDQFDYMEDYSHPGSSNDS
jgi:hypothetical protein